MRSKVGTISNFRSGHEPVPGCIETPAYLEAKDCLDEALPRDCVWLSNVAQGSP